MISGNMVGSYSQMGKTFILVDEDGNEITGVCVDNPVVFTAGDNDVREGLIYAGDDGVSTGTKNIPAYRTTQESALIFPNESFSLELSQFDMYNYTQFQGIITKFNTSFLDSVSTDRVVINNGVYATNSTKLLSNLTINQEDKSIDLNIVNDTEDIYVIHYFTYKEEL